jgi:hypothetical protein
MGYVGYVGYMGYIQMRTDALHGLHTGCHQLVF